MEEFELYKKFEKCLKVDQFPFNQQKIVISEIEEVIKGGSEEPVEILVFTFD
jgi:hypothetical protein